MSRAIYPGSFNPVTNGHLDIIRRAAAIFDELTVGILINPEKSPLFSVEERVKMLEEVTVDLPNVKVVSFSGLLTDYTGQNNIPVCVRGIRGAGDLEYEMQTARYNSQLSLQGLETIFLATAPEFSHISSSGVRQVAAFHGDLSPYVPESIAKRIKDKYNY